LRLWLRERAGHPYDPLLLTRTGRRLSRDAVAQRVSTHAAAAAQRCPSLLGRKIHPHVLRHSFASLQAGVDTSVIAFWPGHAGVRSTNAYVHADITIKERALALTTPASAKPGRYRPPTRCSPSLRACNYADHRSRPARPKPALTRARATGPRLCRPSRRVGIDRPMRMSA
jgi:Phage integrase family